MPRTIMRSLILRARPDASCLRVACAAMSVDFAAAGLLDGLQGEARAARERLLQRLYDAGVTLDELRAAVAEDRLVLLPAERLIGGEPRYTGLEIAEKTGLEPEFLQALRKANGLPVPPPDAVAYTEVLSAAEREAGRLPGARDVAVGFADLVGFTRIGEEVPPDELGRVADRLETLAAERIAPPVRLVKTIGDAVMLVSPDTPALVHATLSLVEAADGEGEDFPQLRAGLARGPALSRAGDWYGQPVNLASRITARARPGS